MLGTWDGRVGGGQAERVGGLGGRAGRRGSTKGCDMSADQRSRLCTLQDSFKMNWYYQGNKAKHKSMAA